MDVEERIRGLSPRVKASNGYARQKAKCSDYNHPLHALVGAGLDVPWREFNPEKARPVAHTGGVNGSKVHLHQRVVEEKDVDNPFGSSTLTWTVVSVNEEQGTVTMKNPPAWNRSKTVSLSEIGGRFTPQYLTDGQPEWGY